MSVSDSKSVKASLKKGEVKNIYYIYGSNVPEVQQLTKAVIKSAVGDNEDMGLTRIDGKRLDFSELYDMMGIMPMITDYNCILINDYNCERPYEDMRGQTAENVNKKLFEVIKEIPEHTVLIFNVTGFEVPVKYDYKTRTNVIKDKNKKLSDFAAKNGVSVECGVKSPQELAKDIAARVSARGSAISLDNAKMLADMCLNDTLTIANEIDKLCAYAGGREITADILRELVHSNTDFDIFKLADAVAAMNRKDAFEALDDLMSDKDNRGAVLAAITNSFIDMYRAACARESGRSQADVERDFSYTWGFKVKNAFRDSSRMSVKRLRECIRILRDTTVKLNSTANDEKIALEQAVTQMLITKN